MKQYFQDISETFNALERIYIQHINSFDTELMPDLERGLLERKLEFDKLKKIIAQLISKDEWGHAAETESMSIKFTERIQTLLKHNGELEKKVSVYKDYLQEEIKKLSRGKQVMSAYGSPSSVLNRPRAINLITN